MDATRTVGYVRCSTTEQATEGVSVDAQRDIISRYSDLYELGEPEFLIDEGYSGKDLNRPGIQGAIRRADAGEVDHIVVVAIDRLSRRTIDVLRLVTETFGDRVAFHSVRQQIDTSSAMGKFMLTQWAALAELERGLTSERTRDALAEKKRQGKRVGEVCFGFQLAADGKALEPHPDELDVVRRMLRWRTQGRSYGWIARRLTKLGVPTKKNGTWAAPTVMRIVKNDIYAEVI